MLKKINNSLWNFSENTHTHTHTNAQTSPLAILI